MKPCFFGYCILRYYKTWVILKASIAYTYHLARKWSLQYNRAQYLRCYYYETGCCQSNRHDSSHDAFQNSLTRTISNSPNKILIEQKVCEEKWEASPYTLYQINLLNWQGRGLSWHSIKDMISKLFFVDIYATRNGHCCIKKYYHFVPRSERRHLHKNICRHDLCQLNKWSSRSIFKRLEVLLLKLTYTSVSIQFVN